MKNDHKAFMHRQPPCSLRNGMLPIPRNSAPSSAVLLLSFSYHLRLPLLSGIHTCGPLHRAQVPSLMGKLRSFRVKGRAKKKWKDGEWKSLSCVQLLATQNSPGQNIGVGSWSLHGIFPTQGSNPGLLHCRQILYQLNHHRSPNSL